MNLKPLVSVLMTSYNREKYIAEAIESVLASTYKNFELIIVDDCSQDNTLTIAKSYALKDNRIKIYLNEKNIGDYPNRNMAASFANGKYLKYLDADDKILEYGLEYCVSEMEKIPEAGLGMFDYFNDNSNSLTKYFTSHDIIKAHFFSKQHLIIGPSGTIIKKAVFENIGRFDTRFGVASDMYFNISIASHAPVILLPQDFFFYRLHDGQQKNNHEGYLINNYLLMNALCNEIELPLTTKEIKYIKRKNKKRFSINLVRYLLQTKSLRSFNQIRKKCNYSYAQFLVGILQ